MDIEGQAEAVAAAHQQLAKVQEVLDWMNAEDLKVAQWASEHPEDYRGFNRRLKAVRDEARKRFIRYAGVVPIFSTQLSPELAAACAVQT